MPTSLVTLSTTEYVKVNSSLSPLVLQSLRDQVRIALSSVKPTINNTVFHTLDGSDSPLQLFDLDVDVWALATSDRCSLVVTETGPAQIGLYDGYGNPISSLKGAIDIHNADVHNSVVNRYMHRHTAVSTTITTAITGDGTEYTIDVADATGFAVGDYLHINTSEEEITHPRLISSTPALPTTGPATFTLDRILDIAHPIGSTVIQSIIDMSSAAGTMASPVIYYAAPYGTSVWHVTRLLFELTHGTAGDLGLFGDLTALTNGCVLRAKINNQYYTFTNWKQNSHMKVDMFDVEFDPRSGGGGQYGTTGRGTFTKAGAVIRLDGALGDRIELLVQDDITLLDSFTMKMQGHDEAY